MEVAGLIDRIVSHQAIEAQWTSARGYLKNAASYELSGMLILSTLQGLKSDLARLLELNAHVEWELATLASVKITVKPNLRIVPNLPAELISRLEAHSLIVVHSMLQLPLQQAYLYSEYLYNIRYCWIHSA